MKKIISLFVAAVLMCTVMAGCTKTESVATDGSTSMSKVIESLSEAFGEDTGIEVTYNATGSGAGIEAVLAGRCDIGLSSRDLKDEEKVLIDVKSLYRMDELKASGMRFWRL